MVLGKIFRKSALFLLIGSLKLAMASGWEESFDESEGDASPSQRGFSDFNEERIEVPEDIFETDVVEVVAPSRRRNEMRHSHGGPVMVPFQSARMRKDIQDDTAITGVNAERRLPLSVKPSESSPLLMQDISHQVMENYLPIDLYREAG